MEWVREHDIDFVFLFEPIFSSRSIPRTAATGSASPVSSG